MSRKALNVRRNRSTCTLPWLDDLVKRQSLPALALTTDTGTIPSSNPKHPPAGALALATHVLGSSAWMKRVVHAIETRPKLGIERAALQRQAGQALERLLCEHEAAPDFVAAAALADVADGIWNTGTRDRRVVVAAMLSDIVAALTDPQHHDVCRRTGIIRRGDGRSFIEPAARANERVYLLRDELEYIVRSVSKRTVLDWQGGQPTVVTAPIATLGRGRIDGHTLRGFLGLALNQVYRGTELLTRCARGTCDGRVHGVRCCAGPRPTRYTHWPFETRIPGVVNAGTKDILAFDLDTVLTWHVFGNPPLPDDVLDELERLDRREGRFDHVEA